MQLSGFKDRQGDRRTDAAEAGAGLGQHVEAQRLVADQAHQIDVGIEVRLGGLDPLGFGFRRQPCRHDIRPAADQFGLQIGGQAEGADGAGLRSRNGQAAVGTLADQGGDAVLGEANRFIQGGEFGFGRGAPGMGAILRRLGLKPLVRRSVIKLFAFAAHRSAFSRGVAVGIELIEIGVGAGNRRGKGQTRRCLLGSGRISFRGGGGEQGAVLAEEIKLPVQRQPDAAGVLPAVRHKRGRDAHIVALLHFGDRRHGVEMRTKGGARLLGIGFRLTHTRLGLGQVGRAGQRSRRSG